MKQRLKNLLTIFLLIISMVSLFAIGACTNSSSTKEPSEESVPLVLNYSEKQLTFLDSFYLTPTNDEALGKELSFESSNEMICSVESDGKVVAKGIGTTEIIVKCESSSAKCAVTVIEGAEQPLTVFNSYFDTEQVVVSENEPLDLTCFVKYNKEKYTDATFTYSVSNIQAGKVTNGIFWANKIDGSVEYVETEIFIVASWRGFACDSLTATVKVKIIKVAEIVSDYITINGSLNYPASITLHLTPEGSEVSEIAFIYKRITNGAENADVEFLQDGHSVWWYNGVLKAINEGVCTLIIRIPNADSAPIPEIATVTIIVTVVA